MDLLIGKVKYFTKIRSHIDVDIKFQSKSSNINTYIPTIIFLPNFQKLYLYTQINHPSLFKIFIGKLYIFPIRVTGEGTTIEDH